MVDEMQPWKIIAGRDIFVYSSVKPTESLPGRVDLTGSHLAKPLSWVNM